MSAIRDCEHEWARQGPIDLCVKGCGAWRLHIEAQRGVHRARLRRWLVMGLAVAVCVCVRHGWIRAALPFVIGEFGGPGDSGGGGSDTPFLVGLINFVWSVLRGLIDFLNAVLKAIYDWLVALGRTVFNGLIALSHFFTRIWQLLRDFWTNVVRPILAKVAALIQKVHDFLKHLLQPLIDIITKVRGWVQQIYKNVVRPILDIIDAIRLFLRGLGALGVDWAKELDKKLGEFEDQITTPFNLIQRYLNEALSILDRIVNLNGLFQRLIWIQSLAGYRKPTINFLWNSHSTQIHDGGLINEEFTPPSVEDTASALKDALEGGGGELQATYGELAQQMRIWLRNV